MTNRKVFTRFLVGVILSAFFGTLASRGEPNDAQAGLTPQKMPAPASLESVVFEAESLEDFLESGRTHAALATLEEQAPQKPGGTPAPAQQTKWLLRLRAETQAGRYSTVIELLKNHEPNTLTPEERFWLAQCLLGSGQYSDAEHFFRELASDRNFSLRWQSALGLARALRAQERWRESLAAVALFPETHTAAPHAALERARALLALGRPSDALETLHQSRPPDPENWPVFSLLEARSLMTLKRPDQALSTLRSLPVANLNGPASQELAILLARAHVGMGSPLEGLAALVNFLNSAVGRAPRERAFEELDKIMRALPAPPLSALRTLAADTSEPIRALQARRILARAEARAGRIQGARELLANALNSPAHPDPAHQEQLTFVRIELARLEIENHNPQRALEILENLTGPVTQFWRAIAYLALGGERHWHLALQNLTDSAHNPTAPRGVRSAAAWNAAMTALLLGIEPDAVLNPEVAEFSLETELQFRLAAAREMARLGDPRAPVIFRELLPALGKQAGIPLAEWLLVSGEATAASDVLQSLASPESATVSHENGSAEEITSQPYAEEEAYLHLLLVAKEAESPEKIASLAREFLNRFPQSPLAFRVRLKYGEAAWRAGDFLRAYNILTEAAQSASAPQDAAQAWLLAGRAAAKLLSPQALDQALAAFEEAAQAGGDTAARARFEQALLLNARDQNEQAMVLLERVLKDSSDPSLKALATLELADSLHALKDKPENFSRALTLWQEVLENTDYPPPSRQQAMVKLGLALEASGEPRKALSFLYRALEMAPESGSWLWFERAGFEAGRILEALGAPGEAVIVYNKVGEAGGPRAAEAAAKASATRLQNFLWED